MTGERYCHTVLSYRSLLRDLCLILENPTEESISTEKLTLLRALC